MATARKKLILPEATLYYHCFSYCIPRAFLCGLDTVTNTSYEHRREWVESNLAKCAATFCIDVVCYDIMHNHYSVVLHINEKKVMALTDFQVIERWNQLFASTELTTNYLKSLPLNKTQLKEVKQLVAKWRQRLMDISWFMRSVNEPIARKANAEDDCTGQFWDGRFKSQALLDNTAVLARTASVNLNPIRAKVKDTPETPEFTSIQRRIQAIRQKKYGAPAQPAFLEPPIGDEYDNQATGINYSVDDYMSLMDTT